MANNVRSISARRDKVSGLLTGQPFDSFLAQKTGLLHPVHARYPASKNAVSPKQFFIKELFHKRNRIVHFGEIDFQRADAEMGVTLAAALSQILAAMDAERRRTMEAKHSVQLRAPS